MHPLEKKNFNFLMLTKLSKDSDYKILNKDRIQSGQFKILDLKIGNTKFQVSECETQIFVFQNMKIRIYVTSLVYIKRSFWFSTILNLQIALSGKL